MTDDNPSTQEKRPEAQPAKGERYIILAIELQKDAAELRAAKHARLAEAIAHAARAIDHVGHTLKAIDDKG